MSNKQDKTLYVCPKCDRSYYTVDRDSWEDNRTKHNSIARSLKAQHKCPWERRKGTK